LIQWVHNGLGILTGANTLTPTYTPANGENAEVIITLSVTGNSPCGDATDQMILTVSPEVIATAGPDVTTCEMSPVTITGAAAQQAVSVLWTTNGSGTFENPAMVNPTYLPSAADVILGTVILTMHVSGNEPCGNFTDNLVLTLVSAPLANAGPDAPICQNSPFTFTNASASNYSSLVWIVTPVNAGILSNASTVSPTFTPSADYVGYVLFTLSANGNSLCGNVVANDQMILTVNARILVNAGADQSINEGTSTVLNGSATGGSGIFIWSWEPSELLINNNIANPTTVPVSQATQFVLSVLDITTGCSASDSMIVYTGTGINHPPVASDDIDTLLVNTSGLITLTINDSDPDGDPVSVSICGNPTYGYIDLHSNNKITYTPDPDYIGDDSFCYVLCDNGNPSLCDTAMVYIHIKKPRMDDLTIYNLITPNSDGSNDYWNIRGIEEYPDNKVVIFNRWGDKIREFTGYDNKNVYWDGTNKENKELPAGTYFYILEITNVGSRSGWIYLRNSNE